MAARRTRLVIFTLLILGGLGGGLGYYAKVRQTTNPVSPGPLANVHAHLDATSNPATCKLCHEFTPGITGGTATPAKLCLECHTPIRDRIDKRVGFHSHVEKDDCRRCHSDHLKRDHELVRWTDPKTPFKLPAPGSAFEAKSFAEAHEQATAFALEGAHKDIECKGCHTAAMIADKALVKWEQEKQGEAKKTTPEWGPGMESYLGPSKVCSTCHQDAHVPSQGDDCAKCHTLEAWTPAKDFVHEPPTTRYALEGKHKDVKCKECHLATTPVEPPVVKDPDLPAFKQIVAKNAPPPFRAAGWGTGKYKIEPKNDTLPDSCKVCHENPHRESDAFLKCEDCHSEADWKKLVEGKFDHAKVAKGGFALEGGHASAKVTCAKCHGEKADKKVLHEPARELCKDCHQKDDDKIHKGGFDREVSLDKEKGCALCHTVDEWKKDTYDRKRHANEQLAALPLIEGHEIRCEDCHANDGIQKACTKVGNALPQPRDCTERQPGQGFKRLPAQAPAAIGPLEKDCQSCHWDTHEGRLTKDPGVTCTTAGCHNFKSWQNLAQLDAAGHEKIGFPIRGAHLKIFEKEDGCTDCHGVRLPNKALRNVALAKVKQNGCNGCHEQDDLTKGHAGQLGNACEKCHTEDSWAPSTYTLEQHKQARFKLERAHAAVPCAVCHIVDNIQPPIPPGGVPPAKVQLPRYKWEREQFRCITCHQPDWVKAHGNQFRGQDCNQCHTEDLWIPSTYGKDEHLRLAKFALTGSHDVACSKCHTAMSGGIVKYEGIPTECAGCHEDPHANQFKNRARGCTGCHTLERWVPSTFDHDQARFALRGAHVSLECKACHLPRDIDGKQVAHYFPIEERACDDCHQNPHTGEKKPAEEGGK